MGQIITRDYAGKELVLIGVLTGAVVFLSDLMRTISLPVIVDLMWASSYGGATQSLGSVHLTRDVETDIEGKEVLVVEDIVDSGRTLYTILQALAARRPSSLKVCTLLDKPSRREVDVAVSYRAFTVDDQFVVGYGLDLAGRYRHLPYIGVVPTDGA